MDIRSTLSYIRLKRLLRRIYWKLIPISEQRIDARLALYQYEKQYPIIFSVEETIRKIITDRCSIARYGDGEYNLCMGRPIFFQVADPSLQRRLTEILQDPDNGKCLIGIAEFRTERLTPFWRRFWYENLVDIYRLLKRGGQYYNQGLSREVTLDQIIMLSETWADRNIIFVTGTGSRFHDDHEIFSSIKSKINILSLPKNAWLDYQSLLQRVRSAAEAIDAPLVICSLGPTATVLAYDLAISGIQALDIGHISNVYDTLKYGARKPEDITQ